MDDDLRDELFLWRLVPDICSLEELDTVWNLDDVLRGHAILDMRAYYSEKKSDQLEAEAKSKNGTR